MRATHVIAATSLIAAVVTGVGCSKRESGGTTTHDSAAGAAAPSSATASPPASTASGDTIVRATVRAVSDSALTVQTPSGEVRIALTQPVQVYSRQPAQLSRVTEGSFIGVTSVPQQNGTQRATEIHIFPEELRGLGEGSRLMNQQGGAGSGNRMTNGAVGASQMTNGSASRMTNGKVGAQAGGTLTVNFAGGSQTISVPAGVTVMAIVPTQTKLSPGANVVVVAAKQPDGTLKASRVMLTGR